jgi:cytochrome c oxidase cbb3-type subunit 3
MRIVIHYLESTEGVAIWPIIGLVIFFSFFLFLVYYIYHLDKGFVKDMADAPLDDGVEKNENLNNNTDL